jgi:quercetin dioxygenase-like cupin family protein
MALTVHRGTELPPAARGAETFVGEAWRNPVFAQDNVSAGNNFFAPCARTNWHTHDGGQLLIVTAGSGFVTDDDGSHHVSAGDMIWTPPGIRHWHGGSPSGFLLHISVTIGETSWHGAVTDEEYEQAGPAGLS